MPNVTLIQAEWCPHSHRVRHLLTVHGVDYATVNVPAAAEDRDDLEAATGQRSIPALVVDGVAVTDGIQIARIIAERFPADGEAIGKHEQEAAPVVAARLDSGDVQDLIEQLGSRLASLGFRLVEETLRAPGVDRSFALDGDDVYRPLIELDPRARVSLPLRVVFHEHPNGAVAQMALPDRFWMHFHDTGLNRRASELRTALIEAFESVGDRAGVA